MINEELLAALLIMTGHGTFVSNSISGLTKLFSTSYLRGNLMLHFW